jgi:ATP adenylyltransferase
MERIWAGWRSAYVADATGGPPSECALCEVVNGQATEDDRLVVHADALVTVALNLYPYTSGHLLVLPRRHVSEPADLDEEASRALWATTLVALEAVKLAYRPDGVNFGANLGRAAGAGIPGHFHIHVLPRWSGDANFLTTLAETRVLPEALPDSLAKLRVAWPEAAARLRPAQP